MPFILLLLLFLFSCNNAVERSTVTASDIEILTGNKWSGTLTYLDYQTSEPFSMPTELEVNKISETKFGLKISYPNEPQANGEGSFEIEENGAVLNNQEVLKVYKKDAVTFIETTSKGKDDDKPATFYFTYEISANQYLNKKEVIYEGTEERILRNTYSYSR